MRTDVALVIAALLLSSVSSAQYLYAGKGSGGRVIPKRHLPFAGNGTCGEHVYDADSDSTTVQCLGPAHYLSPGQTIDTMMLLESPYPKDQMVIVLNNSAQMVDSTLRPVPLSELYVHHYGSALIQGSGAELRGSFTRPPLAYPYVQLINGSEMQSYASRFTNIQLINTIGVPADQIKSCVECWCDHDPWHPKDIGNHLSLAGGQHPQHDRGDPTHRDAHPGTLAGSLLCCHQCPTTTPMAGPIAYHLQYTITYRALKPGEEVTPVTGVAYDVMDGDFEYQLTKSLGQGSTHVQTLDTTADSPCPQKAPFQIVRCIGHQHFGSQCLSLYDLDKDREICNSCPQFGTKPGVPGDEEGYVVRIPVDDLGGKPYHVKPDTRIRITSKYDASVPRFGIMGLMFVELAGTTGPCPAFGGGNNTQVQNSLSSSSGAYHVPLYGLATPFGRDATVAAA